MSNGGRQSPTSTPMEPKTPRSETHRDTPLGDDASSAAAASVVATLATSPREPHSRQPAGGIRSLDVNLPFQTPVRRTAVFEPSGATDGAYCRGGGGGGGSSSSSSSSSRDGAIRESSEKVCAGKGGDEGFQTPSLKEVSCAICLSPLVKLSGEKLEVYTIQLCRHNFHRGCLTENRRAGNTGCPYCRGTLEQGLTPEATTAEKEASAAAARRQDQRQAIRNAAGRARMALARSLRRGEQARTHEAATAASRSAEERSDAPILAMT